MSERQADLRFEPLASGHNRAAFTCGTPALDNYLQRQARQDMGKRAAAVFVLTPDGRKVAGYYTLSQFCVQLDALPEEEARKLPKYPNVPATLLGRLAVSSNFQGQRLGKLLLMDALSKALDASKRIASACVVVDAKDENAANFYSKYGFIDLVGIPNRLFLPIAVIEAMFE